MATFNNTNNVLVYLGTDVYFYNICQRIVRVKFKKETNVRKFICFFSLVVEIGILEL